MEQDVQQFRKALQKQGFHRDFHHDEFFGIEVFCKDKNAQDALLKYLKPEINKMARRIVNKKKIDLKNLVQEEKKDFDYHRERINKCTLYIPVLFYNL